MRGRFVSVSVALAVTLHGALASADASTCAASYDRAQVLRDNRQLRDARQELLQCTKEECPGPMQRDCAAWLEDVEARLPTVTFRVKSARTGRELVDVQVTADGVPVVDRIDGRLVQLDPGVRTLRFATRQGVLEEQVIIREGEKNRVIDVPLDDSTSPASGASRPFPVLATTLAGVGVLGIAGFAYFAGGAKSDVDEMRATCAPACAEADVDDARPS